MRGEIARSSGWDGECWQTRTDIEAERVCVDQRGSRLVELFWYWQERSMLEDAAPSIANFRFPNADLPWVEVQAEDPMNYVIRNHPGSICGNWSDTRLAEHPVQMHALSCAYEYLECKERQKPTFLHICQRIFDVERKYTRLAVPLSDEKGDVTRIVFATRLQQFQVIHGRTG